MPSDSRCGSSSVDQVGRSQPLFPHEPPGSAGGPPWGSLGLPLGVLHSSRGGVAAAPGVLSQRCGAKLGSFSYRGTGHPAQSLLVSASASPEAGAPDPAVRCGAPGVRAFLLRAPQRCWKGEGRAGPCPHVGTVALSGACRGGGGGDVSVTSQPGGAMGPSWPLPPLRSCFLPAAELIQDVKPTQVPLVTAVSGKTGCSERASMGLRTKQLPAGGDRPPLREPWGDPGLAWSPLAPFLRCGGFCKAAWRGSVWVSGPGLLRAAVQWGVPCSDL